MVSGIGTLGSFGLGVDALRGALARGVPATSEIDRSASDPPCGGARLAALVGQLDLSSCVKPAAARRMSGPSKLAVAAARLAVRGAGLEGSEEGWCDTAVVMSTAFGPADFTERLIRAICVDGPATASPFHFTESVANAPAAQIAIDCRARGPNVTVTQREAGALLAVGRAVAEVASGRVRRALAGSVEEMTPLLHALLDRFGALARATPELPEAARPFDRRRNGLLAGEGATVLVLEREEDVVSRGGPVLARARAGASAFDPTASRVGWGRGAARLARSLGALLGRLGLRPQDIDTVVSGASGARAGDRLEAELLQAVFGEAGMPALVAPKSITGEYGGGHLGAAVLAAGGGEFSATAGFAEADPELRLRPHGGGRLAAGRVLATSLAAGGAAGLAGARAALMRLAAVIPALDAAATIGDVARRTRTIVPELLVIDDGSRDDTAGEARRAGAEVVSHAENRGKGAALRHAFDILFGRGADAVVTLDADGQHLPEEIPKLLRHEQADLVIGGREHLFAAMGAVRRASNRLSSAAISAVAGAHFGDVQSGFRLYRKALVATTGFPENRFDAESAVVVRAVRRGLSVISVPVRLGFADGRVTSHYRPLVDSVRIARAVALARWGTAR